jgi:predicted nucleotidyltransferase
VPKKHEEHTRELASWIVARYSCQGVLIYGSSSGKEFNPSGDIDIVCIWSQDETRALQTTYLAYDLDLILTHKKALLQAINGKVRGNENYLLRALATGHILSDPQGELEELAVLANEVWSVGPSSTGDQERRNICARARKVLVVTARLSAQSTVPLHEEHYRDVRASIMLDMLIKDYCRVYRLWCSSLKDLLSTKDDQYLVLRTVLAHYMEVGSVKERLQVLTALATQLHEITRTT